MRDPSLVASKAGIRQQAIKGGEEPLSGREQCDPGQSILVAPIAGRYDEAGDSRPRRYRGCTLGFVRPEQHHDQRLGNSGVGGLFC
jgi:hypothetical protein